MRGVTNSGFGLFDYTNNVHRLVVTSAGAVGIGTTGPAFTLHVNGSAGKPGGGSWSVASDRRLKKDIRNLDQPLDRLLTLRGVTFEYSNPMATNELPGRQTGMVAQDVEQVFPEWVDTAADGYKRLTFRGFEALTVEALRQLRNEKDGQLAQLEDAFQRAIKEQQAMIERLLTEIESLRTIIHRDR